MSGGRWSTSNLIMPISYKEFQSLTAAFNQAATRAFGTDTKLEIIALSANKRVGDSKYNKLQAEWCHRMNECNTILKTDKPDGLTKEVWQKAAYVEVIVRPVDESKAPQYAFGLAEFKGLRPLQATFYIQSCLDGYAEQVKKEVLATRPRLSVTGDGFTSNAR